MLGNINKVSTNIDLSKKYKAVQTDERLRPAARKEKGEKDEVQFSPFASYINEIGWDLRGLQYHTSERFTLTFAVNGVEFETEIDYSLMMKQARRVYRLISRVDPYTVQLLVSVKNASVPTIPRPADKVIGIKKLMVSIGSLGLESEISDPDHIIVRELLRENEGAAEQDMKAVTSSLHYLLQKLEKMLISSLKFPPSDEPDFIIQRVSSSRK